MNDEAVEGFTEADWAAMKERVQELKAEGRPGPRAPLTKELTGDAEFRIGALVKRSVR